MIEDNLPIPTILKERKYNLSNSAMVLRVKRYFEQELRTGHRIKLKKIFERTASAAGASKLIVCKIKTEKDVENWRFRHDRTSKLHKNLLLLLTFELFPATSQGFFPCE